MNSESIHSHQNRWIHFTFVAILLLINSSCYKEIEISIDECEPVISFDEVPAGIDFEQGMLLLPVPDNHQNGFHPVINSNVGNLVIDGREYFTGDAVDFSNLLLSDSIVVSFRSEDDRHFNGYIYFTSLPVVQIFCSESIQDEPKVYCTFIVGNNTEFGEPSIISDAGIEIRGRSAASRPKKSYGIELWDNFNGNVSRKINLLGMRCDDDWILDAMYIDKARMRNKVNMEIWRDVCASSTVDYHGKPFIDSRYVELFVNSHYRGIYNLSERFDRKQLDLSECTTIPEGLLYKSESWSNTIKFIELADTANSRYWDGWEQKFPDPAILTHWNPLFNFHYLVTYANDEEFAERISNYVDYSNLTDYYLLVALCLAFDNLGMNMYYGRSESEAKFLIYPWDMDASWGRNWDSTYLRCEGYLSNKCYDRIFNANIGDCNEQIKERWSELRNSIFRHDSLMNRFEINAEQLVVSGAWKRELQRWPEMNLDIENELDYIDQWMITRLAYMDNFIAAFEDQVWE